MWNPFRTKSPQPDLLLQALQLQHETTLEALRSMSATAEKMAEASKAQAESFTAYLSLFKIQAPPESRVMRDQDEYEQQLRRDGFPVDGGEEAQLRWVLSQTE